MEQIKKYIRGNANRGDEVIAELEKLGGKNILQLKGDENDALYYISTGNYILQDRISAIKEDSFTGHLLLTHPDWEEIELPKDKYPKTYEECCKELNIEIHDLIVLDNILDTKEIVYRKNLDRLLNSFRKLLICRDAYWKIYGEENGLGKPWKPSDSDYITERYCIFVYRGNIIRDTPAQDCLLTFPTAEMSDDFYGNFKELINECKELL